MDMDRIARSATRNTLSGPGVFDLDLHTLDNQFGGLSLFSYSEDFPDDPIAEIDFDTLSPDDPTAATWSRLLGSTLIGIGHGHNQHENVYSDADGRSMVALS